MSEYIVKTSEPHPWMWGIYHSKGTSCQPYEEFSSVLDAQRRADELNRERDKSTLEGGARG